MSRLNLLRVLTELEERRERLQELLKQLERNCVSGKFNVRITNNYREQMEFGYMDFDRESILEYVRNEIMLNESLISVKLGELLK